jgi:two-component system, cell cycle sensor histidine kinase and response regulator CckA
MAELIFVLNNAPWPSFLTDEVGKIYHASPAARKVFGQAVVGNSATLSEIWSAENGDTPDDFIVRWAKARTMAVPLKFRAQGNSVISYFTAVSDFELEEAEYLVWQLMPFSAPLPAPAIPSPEEKGQNADAHAVLRQKLGCALQLARTVALDFNNALTSILGHTSLILSRIEPNHPWHDSLVEVEKSAARAAEIASDLANFSREEKESRVQVAGNLNQLLQDVADTFQKSTSDKVSWKMQLTRKLYTAKFDEAKIQQVFTKILENAVQSLGKHGVITVQSRNLDLTAPTQDRNVQLAAGSYVCAEITDNGCGIAADVLPRVFEPFFTTKKPPHRGLGLAWVYGVVTNHGGGVTISSEEGVGTSVRVYLPADKKFIPESGFQIDDLKGTQTVLLVDDEDLLLTMGQAILSSFGYKVVTANSGPKALEILAKAEPAIDLVVTDLVMPGMSGRELVEQVRKLKPKLRILRTSGYLVPGKDERDTLSFLQKPFTSRDLLLKVKQTLTATDEPPPAGQPAPKNP